MSLKYDLILKLKQEKLDKQWRRLNKHNFTNIKSIFQLDRVSVGKGTYGSLDIELYGNQDAYVKIGHYCSIARDVRFIADGGHDLNNVSLYPFKVRYLGEHGEASTKGPIIVDDDVWIGERSLILSGVHIGQGAVIGAGAIVTKNVPPYAVFGGGRIIKYRFDSNVIEKLLMFDYSKIKAGEIELIAKDLYSNPSSFLMSSIYKKYKRE